MRLASFARVTEADTLRRQLHAPNLHDGQLWLDDERLTQAESP
ncbi:hypothetical protein [Roseateles saccharophilus]|uniref:Uncharacterized protein n=1 Tax=Roseateles saccharophilus TaxID=304 RepID=A0A4R3UIT4_ROSSA|nr:hypothetical protein [Roseateles saccharophilus]TCU88934.1 hypothetical protein EV671_103716 [Roseateles saccharophilus]